MAPKHLAVPIAESPATPVPNINTYAGGTEPAALMYYLENLGYKLNASKTALYPAKLA